MDAGKQVGVGDIWAPNRFEFALSADDAERFDHAFAPLSAELKRVVLETAAERNWGLVGPPEVEFGADPNLKKGEFTVEASLAQVDEPVEVPSQPGGASLTLREDGAERTVPLGERTVTIGRLPDCEVVLKDRGASRRHAQIRGKNGSYTLTDLGSTNGTKLNGQTVQTRPLEDGDRITIGSTVLEFRRA